MATNGPLGRVILAGGLLMPQVVAQQPAPPPAVGSATAGASNPFKAKTEIAMRNPFNGDLITTRVVGTGDNRVRITTMVNKDGGFTEGQTDTHGNVTFTTGKVTFEKGKPPKIAITGEDSFRNGDATHKTQKQANTKNNEADVKAAQARIAASLNGKGPDDKLKAPIPSDEVHELLSIL